MAQSTSEGVLGLLDPRRGHFRYESGYHSDLWLDLELLCFQPERVEPLADRLSRQLAGYDIEAVCGPLNEGAFVALMVAGRLGAQFAYAERRAYPERQGLFTVEYRVPEPFREQLTGKRVAIVNDVISAGSAVKGTLTDLLACRAEPVVIGALLVLGEPAFEWARDQNLTLETLEAHPNNCWKPEECPLCAAGEPLTDLS